MNRLVLVALLLVGCSENRQPAHPESREQSWAWPRVNFDADFEATGPDWQPPVKGHLWVSGTGYRLDRPPDTRFDCRLGGGCTIYDLRTREKKQGGPPPRLRALFEYPFQCSDCQVIVGPVRFIELTTLDGVELEKWKASEGTLWVDRRVRMVTRGDAWGGHFALTNLQLRLDPTAFASPFPIQIQVDRPRPTRQDRRHASTGEPSHVEPREPPADDWETQEKALAQTPEGRACSARGGDLHRVGMMQTITCVLRMKDAGKSCSDGADCQAHQCLAPQGAVAGQAATGTCAPTDSHFGCAATVVKGTVERVMCAD